MGISQLDQVRKAIYFVHTYDTYNMFNYKQCEAMCLSHTERDEFLIVYLRSRHQMGDDHTPYITLLGNGVSVSAIQIGTCMSQYPDGWYLDGLPKWKYVKSV